MKIRFVVAAFVLAAATSACGSSPVAPERASRTVTSRFDGTIPPPDSTQSTNRGGGAMGSGG